MSNEVSGSNPVANTKLIALLSSVSVSSSPSPKNIPTDIAGSELCDMSRVSNEVIAMKDEVATEQS